MKIAPTLAALLLAVTLTGCGGGSDDGKPSTPDQQLTAGIQDVNSQAKVKITNGNAVVTFPYSSTGGSTARDAAKIDMKDMLEAAKKSKAIKPDRSIRFKVAGTLVDVKGAETKTTVINAYYTGKTVSSINFKNFRFANTWEVADDAVIHPAINK